MEEIQNDCYFPHVVRSMQSTGNALSSAHFFNTLAGEAGVEEKLHSEVSPTVSQPITVAS